MGFAERVARVEGWGLWESTHYRVLALFCVGVIVSNFSTGTRLSLRLGPPDAPLGMVAAMLTIFQSSFKFTAAQAGGLVSINLAAGALVSPLITWSVLRPARLKLMGLGFLFAAAFSVLGARSTSFTMLAFAQLGMGVRLRSPRTASWAHCECRCMSRSIRLNSLSMFRTSAHSSSLLTSPFVAQL